MGLHLDDPIVVSVGSMALGILGKWFWDRFLAKPSRVTAEMCSKTREVCLAKLTGLIEGQANRLREGDQSFEDMEKELKHIKSFLFVILSATLTLCQRLKVDCDEITRLLAEHGMID
jgi:hypothetical protein